MKYGILKLFLKKLQVPISVPSSSDLESILSPDPIFSDLQLKEINYNAPGNTAWPPDYICINLTSGFDSFKIPYWMCWLHCAYWFIQLFSDYMTFGWS